MKKTIFKFGDWMADIGDRKGIRILTYNPITWFRFFVSGRRNGKVFAEAVKKVYPQIDTALDFGAGTGGYVSALNDLGVETVGLEYSVVGRTLAKFQGASLIPYDCGDQSQMPKYQKDLAYTIEVGEHLPTELSETFVEYIASSSNFVIFSAAFPGQGGQGHINEQEKKFWADLFSGQGFQEMKDESQKFSETLVELGFRGWLPNNIQIFRKKIS